MTKRVISVRNSIEHVLLQRKPTICQKADRGFNIKNTSENVQTENALCYVTQSLYSYKRSSLET